MAYREIYSVVCAKQKEALIMRLFLAATGLVCKYIVHAVLIGM